MGTDISSNSGDGDGDLDVVDGASFASFRQLVRRDWRGWVRLWAPWIGVAIALALVSWMFVKPAPPRRVVIAAGPKDGDYYWFATQRYAKIFADSGITLDVRETVGSVQNYHLLDSDDSITLAIVQGGAAPEGLHVGLKSIGSLYLEPMWVFYRGPESDQMTSLRGKRVAIGQPGSGTAVLAERLLAANGIYDGTPVTEAVTRPSTAADGPSPATLAPAAAAPEGATTPAAVTAPAHPATTTAPAAEVAAENPSTSSPAGPPPAEPLPGARTTFLRTGGGAAADALLAGDADAVFMVISPKAPIVRKLLAADGVRLMSFERHEAYERNFPYLSSVRLSRGTIDLLRDLPPRDIDLVAPAANLVARDDIHTALVPLAAKAAIFAHGRGNLLSRPGVFPSTQFVEFPEDPAAESYFKNGPPFLQRYLPFWVAAWADRTKILLLPLITLIFPLLRIAPPVYTWRIRSKIYRWYEVLRDVDDKLRSDDPEAAARGFDRELTTVRRLEERLSSTRVPLSYADQLYNLRMHTEFVRRQLDRRVKDTATPEPAPEGR